MYNNELIAEFLATLDQSACNQFCALVGLNPVAVLPHEFDGPDDAFYCLQTFLEAGIPLNYLFDSAEIWYKYLEDITEERYHKGLQLIMSMNNPADLLLYFRACYRFGFPALDDANFDVLERLYLQTYPWLSYLNNQTYDDDTYGAAVLEAIKLSGVRNAGSSAKSVVSTVPVDSQYYEDLNAEKSTSIRPVVSPEEAYQFWCDAPICRVHFSLKIDGVNTKTMFSEQEDKGLELAISRGRAADSIDYTEGFSKMLQAKGVDGHELHGRVTGESFVNLKDLAIIQSHYPDKSYKTPKSTAMAMLRAPGSFIDSDFQYLSFCAFDYEGFKPDEAFKLLREAGLQTPPEIEVDGSEIPRDSLEHFNSWMQQNVLDPLFRQGQELGIGSDGVVMFLLADINTERKDKYSDSNIAIKYSHWSAATYTSTVTNIIVEQRRVEASIVLLIEPTVMRDNNTATRVGVGSPDILMNDGVKVGDIIEFERKSEAYNVYLRKI